MLVLVPAEGLERAIITDCDECCLTLGFQIICLADVLGCLQC